MSRFTHEELLAEARRELKQRLKVYPRQVMLHHLSQKLADEQIAKQEAIIDILAELAAAERLI